MTEGERKIKSQTNKSNGSKDTGKMETFKKKVKHFCKRMA